VASLVSGNLATHALLAKNDALLMQIKASDKWNEYQSKSIKIHLLESAISRSGSGDSEASLDRYRHEQSELKTAAEELVDLPQFRGRLRVELCLLSSVLFLCLMICSSGERDYEVAGLSSAHVAGHPPEISRVR